MPAKAEGDRSSKTSSQQELGQLYTKSEERIIDLFQNPRSRRMPHEVVRTLSRGKDALPVDVVSATMWDMIDHGGLDISPK